MERTGTIGGTEAAASGDLAPWQRLPMLMLGFVSLLTGLVVGEARLGWPMPISSSDLLLLHGPLMVSGFLGTVISLERAVAVGRRVAYLAPAASALGGMSLIAGAPLAVGASLITVSSVGLFAASLYVYRRQGALHTATLVLGAGAWLVGNLLWLGGATVYSVVPWWAAFLILTIAGERLELSRLLPPSATASRLFAVLVSAIFVILAADSFAPGMARPALAAALLALTAWLLRNDIARRTLHGTGLTRFIAISLLSGYFWLAVAGLVGLLNGGMFTGASYDATLHAVFLGFVFSMIFGHAPVIFPAVTRFAVPYHPLFYVHLTVLHLSLLGRVAGLLLEWPELRAAAGAANGVAILLFMANTIAAVARGRRTA